MNKFILNVIILLSLLVSSAFADSEDKLKLPTTELIVSTHDGNDLPLYQYPANGTDLVIWISGSGWHDRAIQSARDLANKGIEVWQIDFAEALLQTSSSNFLRNLDARYVADVIDTAHQKTQKRVILMAQSYASIPLLRGATIWQQRKNHYGELLGAVLFSPNLVTGLPALGKDPEYLPIVQNTTLPLMIFQGGLHGSPEHFANLIKSLSSKNTHVYHQTLPGVTSIYYHDENSPETLKLLKALPTKLSELFKFFAKLPGQPAVSQYQQPQQTSEAIPDIKLKTFTGNPMPYPIDLKDANGHPLKRTDYRGKVTVVNFWASWCPPCVEEIPSLNRLREKMQGHNFELISINYADSPQKILEFMSKVSVQFPVLVDPNGKVSQQWNVIGFPSTFVIGKDGKIIYGVNAAIQWDSDEVIDTFKLLAK